MSNPTTAATDGTGSRWAHRGTDLAEMVRVLVDKQLPTEPDTLADLLGRVLDGTYDPREAA